MNMKQIEKRQARSNTPFELAKQIRGILDEARRAYGPTEWDEDDVESQVSDLVFGED